MSNQTWVQTLISSQVDSTALTNSTSPTSILPPAARFTVPANYFAVGQVLRLRATGRVSTFTASPGNITFTFQLGPTSNISVFSSGATALNVTAQTNATWWLDMQLTCRAIGASTSANFIGSANWMTRASLNAPVVGTTTGVGNVMLPDTAPAVGTGFDSTVANIADLFVTFSVANAANSIQTHQYTLESMN